jgi:tripartite-type tricarboxylate transporter receptor subunit TctC
VVAKINADVADILRDPAVQQALEAQGNLAAKPLTPAEFRAKLSRELSVYGDIASRIDLSGG